MKIQVISNILVVASMVFSIFGTSTPAKAQAENTNPGDFVPGELVVGYQKGLAIGRYGEMANSTATIAGLRPQKVSANGVALFKATATQDVNSLMAKVKQDPNVKFVELNYI